MLLRRMLGAIGITDVCDEDDPVCVGRVVTEFDPEVILLDVHLGGVDGISVLEGLAATDPGFASRRLLLVTGDTDPQIHRRAAAAGACGVLTKPFDRDQLAVALTTAASTGSSA
jgi:CheY-like chemotaxis protein